MDRLLAMSASGLFWIVDTELQVAQAELIPVSPAQWAHRCAQRAATLAAAGLPPAGQAFPAIGTLAAASSRSPYSLITILLM
jgi:hypothetical protein